MTQAMPPTPPVRTARHHARAPASVIASALLLFVMVLTAMLGPWLAPHDPFQIHQHAINQASSGTFWLGTDEFGRDILSRLLYGIRPTILVATGATLLATLLGCAMGIAGGYRPGVVGRLIMRFVDVLLCFPPILFALLAIGFWQSGMASLTLVIGVIYAPQIARVAQSATLQVAQLEYVQAEQIMGASLARIVGTAILPNIAPILVVQATLTFAAAILLESGLSYLGLGIIPPEPSWGQMIGAAQKYLAQNPMYLIWPAFFLALTVLAVNILGDYLRDRYDPRIAESRVQDSP